MQRSASQGALPGTTYPEVVGLLPDYSRQAATYDRTRSASPSLLATLRSALEGAPGPRLLDVGGGTGNYALALRAEGWDPLVADRSPEMLERAGAKGLATALADAQALPFPEASFDAAILVAMLHHVDDPGAALAEARRVVRPGGRVALAVFTREDAEDLWLLDCFPVSRAWIRSSHPRRDELLAELPGARPLPLTLEDVQDGSLAALAGRPDLVLREEWRRQTSYFERLGRDHPRELAAGLRRLAGDVAAGAPPRRPGTATVLAWTKPRADRAGAG